MKPQFTFPSGGRWAKLCTLAPGIHRARLVPLSYPVPASTLLPEYSSPGSSVIWLIFNHELFPFAGYIPIFYQNHSREIKATLWLIPPPQSLVRLNESLKSRVIRLTETTSCHNHQHNSPSHFNQPTLKMLECNK